MTHAHLLVLSPYLVTSSSAFDRKKDWHWLRVKSTGGMQIKCERKENISVSSASMPWYTQDVYDTYPLIALTSRGSPLAMPASMKFQIMLASSSAWLLTNSSLSRAPQVPVYSFLSWRGATQLFSLTTRHSTKCFRYLVITKKFIVIKWAYYIKFRGFS